MKKGRGKHAVKRRSQEGRDLGTQTDKAFHEAILGDDEYTPEMIEDLRKLAVQLGIDPKLVQG